MLVRLEINDIAVISHAVFEPLNGLNVITGETGAGKSLLVDSIGLILGDKASRLLIRSGCDEAYVEAVFDIGEHPDEELLNLLGSSGISCEDGQLIIGRKISSDGRSIARINGRTVVLALLREISSYLVDIHGQQDTQRIFDEKYHVDMLDAFASDDLLPALKEYKERLGEYKKIVLEIRNLSASPDSLSKRKEYLTYALKEIEKAGFVSGDEEKLLAAKKHNERIQKTYSVLNEINELLSGEDDKGMSALSRLRIVMEDAVKLKNDDDSYIDISKRAEDIYYETENLLDSVNKLIDTDNYDENEASKVIEKLGLLYELKAKYGNSFDEINRFALNASEELKGMEDISSRLQLLKKERTVCEKALLKASEILSEIRHKKAKELSSLITDELRELEIPSAVFEVEFVKRSKERFFASYGTEDIRFMFSANPGEEARPLSSICSGGEASRIMLAIKSILSDVDMTPTLIFDEIDTGVSGVASSKIAARLKAIGRSHQVLCVTHTAQLAAAAEHNFFISKELDASITKSTVKRLDADGKINEVSRLLSGSGSEESVKLAQKLIASFI